MHRDRIIAERIHDQYVVVATHTCAQFFTQAHSSVTDTDVLIFARGEVRKISIRDIYNARIDLIKNVCVSVSAVTRYGCGTKTDDTNAETGAFAMFLFIPNRSPYPASFRIVQRRQ